MFFSLMVFCVSAISQEKRGSITATIESTVNGPVEHATVELLKADDSTLVKTALSAGDGSLEIPSVPAGKYLVRITALNFGAAYTATFDIRQGETIRLGRLSLQPIEPGKLQNVVVAANKPFIQRLNDRLVVNVESSLINAGSAAIDVLERSPGIAIDHDDVISLRGRAGVIIMIDGKPSPMSGTDLGNYLRGLPVTAIERIEIITNPSAKYDAAGNSGIIDIRLKKDQRLGYNGTINAGYGQGFYPKYNSGFTFNYRNKGINVFGNYSHAFRQNLNHLIINRNFFSNDVFEGSDDKDNFATMPLRSNNFRLGADFFPSKNTIIGFAVNGNLNSMERTANIETTVNDVNYKPYFRFSSIGTNDDQNGNLVANLNFKQKLDTNGRELTADVDYGIFHNRSLTRTASYFFNLNGSKRKDDDILDGDQDGELRLRTFKIDYVQPLATVARLETGFKTSHVSSDNDARFFNVYNGTSSVDEAKTNRFFYDEYNYAGYVNLGREFQNFSLQAGLRGEQTDLKTRQVKGNNHFRSRYFQMFPSAFLTYKIKPGQSIGASVSRRIDRPGYQQLNPFLFQVDATIYSTGAPNLQPQITWSYELHYNLKSLSMTLGYSQTNKPQNMVLSRILDVIPNFEIKPGQDSNITVQIPVNLESSDYVGLTASLPIRVTGWWQMMNNLNVFYNKFRGNLSGAALNDGTPAANFRSNNNFTLGKGWAAELGGHFNSGRRYGYMVLKNQWALNAGIQKNIFANKGTIRLNATDIFWTSLPRAKVEYKGSYIENWHGFRESRVATFSFTYRFGNNNVQQARKRTTASEDEIRRAGGN